MNYWEQIRNYFRTKVSAESYENWLQSTSLLGMDARTLLVTVPDRETRGWLETAEYAALVRDAIKDLGLPVSQVIYEIQPERAARPLAVAAPENGHDLESPTSQLNPKFTFESFVVGTCNQF